MGKTGVIPEQIGRFKLRDWHEFYDRGDDYECVVIDPHDERHSRLIPRSYVDDARRVLSGGEWSVNEARQALLETAVRKVWKFRKGHKYQYYVQDILLILVSLGDAVHREKGRAYWYEVF